MDTPQQPKQKLLAEFILDSHTAPWDFLALVIIAKALMLRIALSFPEHTASLPVPDFLTEAHVTEGL